METAKSPNLPKIVLLTNTYRFLTI